MGDWERAVSYTIFFLLSLVCIPVSQRFGGRKVRKLIQKNYLNITVLPVTATMARAPKGDMN